MTEVLPSSKGFATVSHENSSRGPLSRSVSRSKSVCFRVPPGTASIGRESFFQDIACGILISVHDQATSWANMRANTQRLVDDGIAARTFLAGVLRWYGNDRDSMDDAIVGKPLQEYPPTSVMNAFCQFAVTDHVADLKVLIGNQVVRRDERVCLFAGKIFALPLHFQMLLGKGFPCLLSVGRLLVFARETATKPLESLLRFPVVPRVVYGSALGVGQKALQTYINTELRVRRDVFNFALGHDTELTVVAIGTADNANTLDILDWKGFYLLFLVANQAKTANPTAIGEGDMRARGLELPSSSFVLDASVVMLELRIAFLSGLVLKTVGIEPINSEPCTISTGLTSLGVEARGKRVLFGKDSAGGLQVIFRDTSAIHPQAQTCVADELHRTDSLFYGLVLYGVAIQLVFVDQHASCSLL